MERTQELEKKIRKGFEALKYYQEHGNIEAYNTQMRVMSNWIQELDSLIN